MYCQKCGKLLEEGKNICDECAELSQKEIVIEEKNNSESKQTKTYTSGQQMGFGIASLACGVNGIFWLFGLLFPFSLAFGIVAIVLSKKANGSRWHNFAVAGRITGKVSLIAGAIGCGLATIYYSFYAIYVVFYAVLTIAMSMFSA